MNWQTIIGVALVVLATIAIAISCFKCLNMDMMPTESLYD